MTGPRVVVVTGAGGGIGAAVVQRFLSEGDQVTGTDVGGKAAATGASLATRDAAPRYLPLDADVCDEHATADVFTATIGRWGRVDVVVNTAAVTGPGLSEDLDVVRIPMEVWDQIMAVNLRGTMLVCRSAVPALLATGGGVIVNVSSRNAVMASPRFCAYSASKAAINSLTRHIAAAYGPHGIRCNAVLPGLVDDTVGMRSFAADSVDAQRQRSLVGRLASPNDVAGTVHYLASADAAMINGQALLCDGGASIA